MYQWQKWSSGEEPKKWVTSLIESKEGLLAFLRAFVQPVRSHSIGSAVVRTIWRIRLSDIEPFVAADIVEAKAKGLEAGSLSESAQRSLHALELALEDRRRGIAEFEKLCAQLICSFDPTARTVRNEGGDGGIDVFVGDQANPAGITIFQVKYFPNGLKDSQKQQVRESFRHCRDNARFGIQEWILCVPLDLSQSEIAWFSQWSAKEAPALLPPARMDWWGETKLGHLLLQSANAGIKEAFFPEEHLRRLSEIQQTLTYLVDDLRTRPAQQDLANLVLQQNTMNAWLQYKKDAYVPLHEEFAKIQEVLEQVVLQKSEGNARNITSHVPVQLRQPLQTGWRGMSPASGCLLLLRHGSDLS